MATLKPIALKEALDFNTTIEVDANDTVRIKTPQRKFVETDWQNYDINVLANLARYGRGNGAANWSEMGCYKTTTCLWLIRELQAKKVLLITTKTGKTTYFETAPFVLPEYKLIEVTAAGLETPPKDYFKHTDVPTIYVAHYEIFQDRSKVWPLLWKMGVWDFVGLDEAHRIKNRKAQCTKNIKKLYRKYSHTMTGTGFTNKPDEIWSLLDFLKAPKLRAYWPFRNHYCEIEEHSGFQNVVGLKPKYEKEFREYVNLRGVRRLKREIFSELEEPLMREVLVDLNARQRKMYDEIKKELETLDANGEPISSPVVLSQLTRLRQISCATPEVVDRIWNPKSERLETKIKLTEPSAKLDALMDVIDETDAPFVIFDNFAQMVSLIEARFNRKKIDYIRLLPSDNARQRADKVARFQTGEVKAFLSTIRLGSEAITLTASSRVVFTSRDYSPGANNQAISRCHRPGQKERVEVVHINARRTIDQRINNMLVRKSGWFAQIFST